jgi:hypothetical protein
MPFKVRAVQKGDSLPVAYKFSTRRLETPLTISPEDLRRAFENAVREIHQADLAAQKRSSHRIPIVPHAKILRSSNQDTEKRALSDAARALAQLWKV